MKNGDYILIKCPEWYRGKRYRDKYCFEHHAVWEQANGMPVPEGMIIHHKDGNKFNNNIDNLELLSAAEHARMHGLAKKRRVAILKCPTCGKIFERNAKDIPFRTLVFCSRQCIGKYGFKYVTKEKFEQDKKNNVVEIVRK